MAPAAASDDHAVITRLQYLQQSQRLPPSRSQLQLLESCSPHVNEDCGMAAPHYRACCLQKLVQQLVYLLQQLVRLLLRPCRAWKWGVLCLDTAQVPCLAAELAVNGICNSAECQPISPFAPVLQERTASVSVLISNNCLMHMSSVCDCLASADATRTACLASLIRSSTADKGAWCQLYCRPGSTLVTSC